MPKKKMYLRMSETLFVLFIRRISIMIGDHLCYRNVFSIFKYSLLPNIRVEIALVSEIQIRLNMDIFIER